MFGQVTGIHHVTALSSSAQRNVDLYAGVLGLRLVKRTVNFDAPGVHHLYYGDEAGSPGSIMTFFPYEDLARGRPGKGQLTVTMFSIPEGSVDHWVERLARFNIPVKGPQQRLGGEVFISFEDHDGLNLELVEAPADRRPGNSLGPVAPEHAIKGFHGVVLSLDRPEPTVAVLTEQLGYRAGREGSDRFRFSLGDGPGSIVDIVRSPHEMRGLAGSGTVHHVAFSTPDDRGQEQLQESLSRIGLQVTPVMDRQYFRSIYFREPGGILFEIATEPPGFMIDESQEKLGSELKLPAWAEPQRRKIEEQLAPITVELSKFQD